MVCLAVEEKNIFEITNCPTGINELVRQIHNYGYNSVTWSNKIKV